MRPSLRRRAIPGAALGLLAGLAALTAAPAQADPIGYTFTGTVSGNVNGTAFTNATLTLLATGDTTNVTSNAFGFNNPVGQVSVVLSGFGAGTSTNSLRIFDNQVNSILGLTDITLNKDVFNEQASSFATYDLKSSLGPVSAGFPTIAGLAPFQTSLGTITITSSSSDTFTAAAVPAVPEASTTVSLGLLLALGMGGVLAAKKRKTAS
jgi:hypothetical protein